jgi:uncharacterized protein YndB with AHSA1/START domain
MTQSLDLTWPPQPVTPSLTKVVTAVQIACSPERAFAYATNASLWHTWHPATAQVRDVNARPLKEGETIHESIVAIGQKFDAVWTVLACEAPHLWVIATRTERGSARIVYRISPHAQGCEFHRTLEYRSYQWPWVWLENNFTRWMLGKQSQRALEQLKLVLETPR